MKIKKIISLFSLLFISVLYAGNPSSECQISDDIAKIENILKRKKDDIGCMLIVANKYLKDGELSKGFMYISEAYKINPEKVKRDNNPKVLDMALSLYAVEENAIKRKDANAWNYLGDRYFKMKVFPEAKKAYEKSLEINPAQNQIRTLYAVTLYSLNQHYRAIIELKKVLKNNQNDVYAHFYMGKILKYAIGDKKKALSHFKKAKELLESKKHHLDNKQILYITKDLKKELL